MPAAGEGAVVSTSDPWDGSSAPAESDGPDGPDGPDRAEIARRARGGKWRRLLAGGRDDEFSESGPPLTDEQREHLARVTDDLMKRYSISRTGGFDGSEESAEGEPISADEFEAVLHTVLAEAFDFDWFSRPDLPEAPELAFDRSSGEMPRSALSDDRGIRVEEPLQWAEQDPDTEIGELESSQAWASARSDSEPIPPSDPEPIPPSDPEPMPRRDPQPMLHRDPEPIPGEAVPRHSGGLGDVDLTSEADVAERVVAELEQVFREATDAERAAILFAAAARQRLAEARRTLAALQP